MKQSAISPFVIDLCSNLYNFINQVVFGYTNSMDLDTILQLEGGSHSVSSSHTSDQTVGFSGMNL